MWEAFFNYNDQTIVSSMVTIIDYRYIVQCSISELKKSKKEKSDAL